MNPRFRYFTGPRKSPWKWATQSLRTLLPYRGQKEEDCELRWIWSPHFAEEWEAENMSQILYPGDAGYETAKYEIGFLVAKDGRERFV